MQTLSEIVPDYAGQVDFYVVAYTETARELDSYVRRHEFTGMTPAQPEGSMLRDLKIISQSAMLAMDAAGVITFRKESYRGKTPDFRAEFERLIQ